MPYVEGIERQVALLLPLDFELSLAIACSKCTVRQQFSVLFSLIIFISILTRWSIQRVDGVDLYYTDSPPFSLKKLNLEELSFKREPHHTGAHHKYIGKSNVSA